MQAHRVALLRNTLKLYFKEHIASDALVARIVADLDIYSTTFSAIPPHLNTKITSGRKNNQRTRNAIISFHLILKKYLETTTVERRRAYRFPVAFWFVHKGGRYLCTVHKVYPVGLRRLLEQKRYMMQSVVSILIPLCLYHEPIPLCLCSSVLVHKVLQFTPYIKYLPFCE